MEYVFTFLEGIASFISPCILPLVPIYVSYFAGGKEKNKNALINSISFVIGFSVVYILLAMVANTAGNIITQYMKYIKVLFGIIIIIMGLTYIGILKINLFAGFKKFNANVKNLTFFKSMIFGMLFSISITPCIGTFLTSALLVIASKTEKLKGLVLIIFYCLGLGIPFIISSVIIDRLKNVFTIIKKNYNLVKIISGMVLILMGIYVIFWR